jgi:hypothetical protein
VSCVGLLSCGKSEIVTASAPSPDGKSKVLLIEKDDFRIDRNFDVFLEDCSTATPKRTLLFSSPDEGKPVGTERFVWSKDSQFILLVGRQFGTKGDVKLKSGESLYLLYDVKNAILRCNASQQDKYGAFTGKDVEAIPWAGAVAPK